MTNVNDTCTKTKSIIYPPTKRRLSSSSFSSIESATMFIPIVDVVDDDDSSSVGYRELKNKIISPPCSGGCTSSLDTYSTHSMKDRVMMNNYSPNNHDQSQQQQNKQQQQQHTVLLTYRSNHGHSPNHSNHMNNNDTQYYRRYIINKDYFDNFLRKRFLWSIITILFIGSIVVCQIQNNNIRQLHLNETEGNNDNHSYLRRFNNPMLATSFSLNTSSSSSLSISNNVSSVVIVSEITDILNKTKKERFIDFGSNPASLLTSLSKLTRGNTKSIPPDVLWTMTKIHSHNIINNNNHNNVPLNDNNSNVDIKHTDSLS